MNQIWMKEALELARRGRYTAFPNPMVGAVVVQNGIVVGRGFHDGPGKPHAEINALQDAGDQARAATLYVTLEPCCHFGRTPPCTNAIIAAGIAEVWTATRDLNPLVSGQGLEQLKAAGIVVHEGLLEQEARNLNRAFFHYITTKTPYLIAKTAMSLDGKMIVNEGDSPTLSSSESLRDLHDLRQATQAILIGSGTALKDNPSLTTRYADPIIRHPDRFVLNRKADLPPTLKLFDGSLPNRTHLICSPDHADDARTRFNPETTHIIPAPSLIALMPILGALEILSILVEGGPTILREFYNLGLINEVMTYVTPFIIADLPHKQVVADVSFEKLGHDYKMRGLIGGKDVHRNC